MLKGIKFHYFNLRSITTTRNKNNIGIHNLKGYMISFFYIFCL